MKQVWILAAILLVSFSVHPQKAVSEDISILRPNDRSYADAMNLAALLEERGLHVKTMHKSKMEGFFRDIWKAAVFKTDKGVFEVIFFPEPGQAEKITVKEVRDGKRYIYSFEGQPYPNPPSDVINAAFPMRFIPIDTLFVVVSDNEGLYELLKKIFT